MVAQVAHTLTAYWGKVGSPSVVQLIGANCLCGKLVYLDAPQAETSEAAWRELWAKHEGVSDA